jgi:hypothetical protein
MEEIIYRLPNWARWVLLLPVSALGGFAAGFLIYAVWSAPAARPDAPIVFIAQFAAGILSIYGFLYIARLFAPTRKATVVLVLIVLELASLVIFAASTFESKDLSSIILFTGNLVGCGVGWFQLVHKS